MKRIIVVVIILFGLLAITLQRIEIKRLEGIVQDQAVYIDSGCSGRYQGN